VSNTKKPRSVSVIGGGAWGTAIANHVAVNGTPVLLWAYEKEVVEEINGSRTNTVFLPGIKLGEKLEATGDLAKACSADVIFFVVPSHVMEGIINKMIPAVGKDAIIVSSTKGIETKNLRLPSEIFDLLLPPHLSKNLVCFSGPSFAREVALGLPTAITAASRTTAAAEAVQEVMSNAKMRIYTHDDLMGVELGGAVKNVVAIAAGISDGLKLGHNARAAIITRGLAEMTRLGRAFGARADTFSGLSGIGDLILTATGDLSRNRTAGIRLGAGETVAQITDGMKSVAEGILTSKAIHDLAAKKGVDMPVCREVYEVCHEGKNPKLAVADLMGRKLKGEFY
jgi:glycerol-3-phosphate dehydrogenase (NAD(P)+)